MMKGKLITFEGCEGVGKSKQITLLKEYLENSGQNPLVFREPGSTNISEGIRGVILDPKNTDMSNECELLLYLSARAQLVREQLQPALQDGRLVICDRYIDSSVAYQGYARGLGEEIVSSLNAFAIDNCIPDCTIFLDLKPEDAFKRKGGADISDRLESEDLSFHKRVYQGYLAAKKNSNGRICSIYPIGSVTDTQNKIRSLLKEKGLIK